MNETPDRDLVVKGVVLYLLAIAALLGACAAIGLAVGLGWRIFKMAAGG